MKLEMQFVFPHIVLISIKMMNRILETYLNHAIWVTSY